MRITAKIRVAAMAFAAFLSLFGAANAITNGVADGENHPYVGLLFFDYAPGEPGWSCSGSLIAPNVVLTAGHCTEGAVAARAWFSSDVTYEHVPFPLFPYGGPGSGAIEGLPYTNPNYRGSEDPSVSNGLPVFSYRDVGVVVLNEPIAMEQYAELPTAGLVDTLKNKTSIDFVGFGVQYQARIPGNQLPGQPPPYYRWMGPRVRMYAPSALVTNAFAFSAEFMRLTLNPGRASGGACFGDSGGPNLLGGTNTVLGVNSYVTNVNCSGVGYSSRIDIPDVLQWIYGFLP